MRYWKRLNQDGTANTVESYSHDREIAGAVEISQDEFNDILVDYARITASVQPDWAKEWQSASGLEAKLAALARYLGLEQ